MAISQPANDGKLGRRGTVLVGMVALTSVLGFYGMISLVFAFILGMIYGHYSDVPWISRATWLSGTWYLSFLLGFITTPVSLAIAGIGSFFPICRRAKVLAWWIALGGALSWFVSASVVLGRRW